MAAYITTAKEFILLKVTIAEECMACHIEVLNHGFKYQDSVCNGCHHLLMLCANISDIAIVVD